MQGWFNIWIYLPHQQGREEKSYDRPIIPTDAEKASDKIQHSFMIETLSKLGVEEKYLIW